MSLITHLQQTSIKNLIDPTRALVTANGQDKVWNTLALLGKNKLLSCPVLNEAENKFVGFVDIIDIMTALVAAGLSLEVVEILTDSPPSLEDFIAVASNALADTNTLEILNASGRNPWKVVSDTVSVFEVMKNFSEDHTLHRVAVYSGEQLIGVVTQFGVIAYLYSVLDKFEDVKNKVFDISAFREKPVYTCFPTESVVDIFERLYDKKITGMPVVDENGEIVGSFSASDIKGHYGGEIVHTMWKSLADFLHSSNKFYNREAGTNTFTAKDTDTYNDILGKIVKNHIHRLFVVDNRHPVGVISLSDIIDKVVN